MTAADSASINAIVTFWNEAGTKGQWFNKDAAFDREFHDRFHALHMEAAARQHDSWMATPEGALALLILLDQFPRNCFRGTGHMYATDPLARHFARAAQAAGHMDRIAGDLRLFFCLPFAHSEDLADQDISVTLNGKLGGKYIEHAEGHRDIIKRFGRFPHRNAMLGRATTDAEARFLSEGGFAG